MLPASLPTQQPEGFFKNINQIGPPLPCLKAFSGLRTDSNSLPADLSDLIPQIPCYPPPPSPCTGSPVASQTLQPHCFYPRAFAFDISPVQKTLSQDLCKVSSVLSFGSQIKFIFSNRLPLTTKPHSLPLPWHYLTDFLHLTEHHLKHSCSPVCC